MSSLFVFGLGYAASHLADRLAAIGWQVAGTGRGGSIAFDDREGVVRALKDATHLLSSVPPAGDADPVLATYGELISGFPGWIGYLSSTGVYGDTGGAWVDESASVGSGRRTARAMADLAWQTHGAHVFRLPGIYGPGRSPLERLLAGAAHRIALPGQVFSRVHVDDIASGVIAGFAGPAGPYNLADDFPCSQNAVIEHGAALLGVAPPPLMTLDEAGLSPAARAFYAENRRVANGRAKRMLGWRPAYPDYRAGLASVFGARSASKSPPSASAQPITASGDQR
jgi:nucleoside-diphosphate-sugar epimerase